MKIFISWSGSLSKKIAEAMNKWLPCLLQTVQIFYSTEDIEKGENWDQRISSELSESNYGIICLTPDNVTAPWVNFEAGAIAKSLESRVATLMININPSDIKGPLSRYQATKLEKNDFLHLIQNINDNSESPIEKERLFTTFEGLWATIESELEEIINSAQPAAKGGKKIPEHTNAEAIEEILQLVRKQNTLLSSPDQLVPREYLEYVMERSSSNPAVINEILQYLDYVYDCLCNSSENDIVFLFSNLRFNEFIRQIGHWISARKDRHLYEHYQNIRRKFISLNRSLESLSPEALVDRNDETDV